MQPRGRRLYLARGPNFASLSLSLSLSALSPTPLTLRDILGMTRKICPDEERGEPNDDGQRLETTGREKLRLVSHGVLSTKFTHCHLGHGATKTEDNEERRHGTKEARSFAVGLRMKRKERFGSVRGTRWKHKARERMSEKEWKGRRRKRGRILERVKRREKGQPRERMAKTEKG